VQGLSPLNGKMAEKKFYPNAGFEFWGPFLPEKSDSERQKEGGVSYRESRRGGTLAEYWETRGGGNWADVAVYIKSGGKGETGGSVWLLWCNREF